MNYSVHNVALWPSQKDKSVKYNHIYEESSKEVFSKLQFTDLLQNACTEIIRKISRKTPVADFLQSKITGCSNHENFMKSLGLSILRENLQAASAVQ